MYTLCEVRDRVTEIENWETGEEAVKDILDMWHEDDEGKLFVVYGPDGNVWATIARGVNKDHATVSRTDGASQRFKCIYTTVEGKLCSEVTSL